MNMILHPTTDRLLSQFAARPIHAVLLAGPTGSGKASLARYLAQKVLHLTPESYASYGYRRELEPGQSGSISIDMVRSLQAFLMLKIPGRSAGLSRVVLIVDAHLLSVEAQNALLKTLEEPPADTLLILTARSREALLPTIQSRVRALTAQPPPADKLKQHFVELGFQPADVDRALLISGELPGLMHALLTSETSHPLYAATEQARRLLGAGRFERLLLVDGLAKQKALSLDTLFVLQQMARMALLKRPAAEASKRWQKIMRLSYNAAEQLERNTQTKLVLTNFTFAL